MTTEELEELIEGLGRQIDRLDARINAAEEDMARDRTDLYHRIDDLEGRLSRLDSTVDRMERQQS